VAFIFIFIATSMVKKVFKFLLLPFSWRKDLNFLQIKPPVHFLAIISGRKNSECHYFWD
jgi:hypothetical protein